MVRSDDLIVAIIPAGTETLNSFFCVDPLISQLVTIRTNDAFATSCYNAKVMVNKNAGIIWCRVKHVV